ncbi:hypothetical protein O3P69_014500 [Scylla paramamosain]|uniref:Uncharacterized protein n=1 Tax=Scylla paramamosain TaxID=85552 RepID=A0AAW0TCE1_SCYPA
MRGAYDMMRSTERKSDWMIRILSQRRLGSLAGLCDTCSCGVCCRGGGALHWPSVVLITPAGYIPGAPFALVMARGRGKGAQSPVASVINIYSQPGQGVNSRQSARQSDQSEHPRYKWTLVGRGHSDSL